MHNETSRVSSDRVPDLDAILSMQFEELDKKKQKSFGLRLAKEMWSYITFGNEGYYQNRYTAWNTAKLWGKGSVNNREFMDLMGVDGNKSWVNMDWNILKLVPSFLNRVTQIFMQREEKPTVTATDAGSASFREREKLMAKYRMKNIDRIREMEAASGMELEGEGYIPEDEDQLDMYYQMEYRMPEEAFFEQEIERVWNNSDYEYLKRELIRDLCLTNLGVIKQERSTGLMGQSDTLANRLRIRRADPMNTVYNIFKQANGGDISIIGEAYALKISDGRRRFPGVTEKEWFHLAQLAQKGLTQAQPLNWLDTYVYSFNRPYDDYAVIVFDFEVKVYDKEYYVKGAEHIDKKKGVPLPNPEKEVIDTGRFNMYGGVWAVGSDIMLEWGIQNNQIRPYQNGIDVFSSYSVVYPHADGFYVPSLIERGIPCVRQMVLCALRIQQMVALMEPDNLSIDVAGLRDVNLGTGNAFQPLELMKIKQQTGRILWDSTDTTGTGQGGNPIPFQNIPYGGNVAQINILIAVYNWWLQRLNEEWGTSQEILGQPTPAKKSAAATEQATIAGGLSIEYIYNALCSLFEQGSTKIGYTLWDDIVFSSNMYKEWAGIDRDLIDTTFDINVEMINRADERQTLIMFIQEALAAKTITMATAARLMSIKNPKIAILYLEKLEKNGKNDQQKMAQMQMQMNAQQQQQSAQIATQGKIAEIQATGQVKALTEKLRGDEAAHKELIKFVGEIEKECAKTGREFPVGLQPVRDLLISGVLNNQVQDQQQQQMAQQQEQGPVPEEQMA